MKVQGVTSLCETYLSPVISQESVGKTSTLPLSSPLPLSASPHHSGSAFPSGCYLYVGGAGGGKEGWVGGVYLAIKATDVIIQGLTGKAATLVSKAGEAPS